MATPYPIDVISKLKHIGRHAPHPLKLETQIIANNIITTENAALQTLQRNGEQRENPKDRESPQPAGNTAQQYLHKQVIG